MTVRSYPFDTLDRARDVLAAYKQLDPELKVGTMTQAAVADAVTQTQATQAQITALELQLAALRNQRDDQLRTLWDIVKRARATVKSIYGDDSSAYKLVGGTRISDRKKGGRRSQA